MPILDQQAAEASGATPYNSRLEPTLGFASRGSVAGSLNRLRVMVSDESVSQALEQAGDSIANQLLAHPGVEEGKSRFADRDSLFLRGKEFFHLDAPGLADVRLGRKLIRSHRDELKAEPLVVLRTDTSDWVNVRFTNMDEAATVVRWAEMAIDAG